MFLYNFVFWWNFPSMREVLGTFFGTPFIFWHEQSVDQINSTCISISSIFELIWKDYLIKRYRQWGLIALYNMQMRLNLTLWKLKCKLMEQGRIHGYQSRVRVGRGHIRGHQTIWAGALRSKKLNHKKSKVWLTDQWTDKAGACN